MNKQGFSSMERQKTKNGQAPGPVRFLGAFIIKVAINIQGRMDIDDGHSIP